MIAAIRCWILVPGLVWFAGCGSGEKQKGGAIEIEYNCAANAADIASLEKEIPSFAAASGIRIRLNPFTGQEKLYAMLAADQAPDIFYTNTTVRDRLAAEGHLLELGSVARDDSLLERLWPHVVENGHSVDGGWYSVGNWEFTAGVYYNRDLIARAGLRPPSMEWTWDDMVRMASALTRDTNGDGLPEQYGVFIGSHFVEVFEQMNHSPIEKNALQFSLPKESAEVFRQYLRLIEMRVMPDPLRLQAMGMQAQQMLQSGRVAMLVEAVPHQTLFETLSIRWGVAPLPRFAGKAPRYFRSGSGGLSIGAHTENPQAAWRALKWLVSSASVYQPNPVLRDADFVYGWERRYPSLLGTGFREVWNLSLQNNGGDPRFFVRFSSWTAGSILERLQPKLDQLWAGKITVRQLEDAAPEINANVRRELTDALAKPGIGVAFRKYIEQELGRLDAEVTF